MDKHKMKFLTKKGFFKEVFLVKHGKCPFCEKDIDKTELRDALSRKEFELSGLCQDCQDRIFTTG